MRNHSGMLIGLLIVILCFLGHCLKIKWFTTAENAEGAEF